MPNGSHRVALALLITGSLASVGACSSRFRSAGVSDETSVGGGTSTGTVAGTSVGNQSSSGSGGTGGVTTATGTSDSTTGSTLVHCDLKSPDCACDIAGCFLILGASCTRATDCKTQVCGVTQEGTNICCATACDQDHVCLADGTGCEVAGACDEGDERCSAEGNHEQCTSGQWQTVAACGARGCSLEVAGGCLGDLGAACLEDDECGAGTCQETTDDSSVCCDASCGDCLVCNQAGAGCTDPDFIKPGCTCTEATAFSCDDNIPCTDDSCDAGRCSNELQSGFCLIDEECIDHNEQEALNPCRYCDATIRSQAWTNSSNTVACDDGAWCNGTDTCNGSGQCQHQFPTDRCTENGACALGTCDEERDSCYRPSSQACLIAGEFRCESDGCGGDVQGRTVTTWCSGTSAECDGAVSATEWEINSGCTVYQKCDASSWSCEDALDCGAM